MRWGILCLCYVLLCSLVTQGSTILFFAPTDLPIKRQSEYELVTPVSTNSEGHYLSHILSANPKRRSPRDVSSNSEQLFFNITAFGRDFHLRLRPNTQLVAPGAVVEWHETSLVPENITDPTNDHQAGNASERIWKTEPLQTNCAYVGDIMDIPGTSVAISNCDGLVRLIPFCVYVFAGVWECSVAPACLEGRGGKEALLLYFKFRKELENAFYCQRCVLWLHFATKTALFREAKDTYFSIFCLRFHLCYIGGILFPYFSQSILKIF